METKSDTWGYKVFIFILVITLFGCRKEKNRICDLYDEEVDYSIGTIQSMSGSIGKATFKFSFEVNGLLYEGKEKAYGIGQKDKTLIGKSFVVVYKQDDPSSNDLNLDFPMDSEAGFRKFQNDYLAGPPSPDFPKCK